MAKKKRSAKPSYYEVVFKGKPKVVRAFLSGLLMGSGAEGDIYYSYSEGVFHEGKAEKFKEMTRFRAIDCHVIMDKETSTLLKKMQKGIATETGLEITSHRSIRSASIELCFEAFARRYNDEIVALLKNLPKGLKLEGFEHDVEARFTPKPRASRPTPPVTITRPRGKARSRAGWIWSSRSSVSWRTIP